jgi:hypothetical protein
MKWARRVACVAEEEWIQNNGGEARGKMPPGRPRRTWLDNIKTDLGKMGWGGVDWIGLAKDRDKCRALVNAVINLRVA